LNASVLILRTEEDLPGKDVDQGKDVDHRHRPVMTWWGNGRR